MEKNDLILDMAFNQRLRNTKNATVIIDENFTIDDDLKWAFIDLAYFSDKISKDITNISMQLQFDYDIHTVNILLLKKHEFLSDDDNEKAIKEKLKKLNRILNEYQDYILTKFANLTQLLEEINTIRNEYRTELNNYESKLSASPNSVANMKKFQKNQNSLSHKHNLLISQYNSKLKRLEYIYEDLESREQITYKTESGHRKQISLMRKMNKFRELLEIGLEFPKIVTTLPAYIRKMHQSDLKEFVPIRSIEDSYDYNGDINQCITVLINFTDSLNEHINDLYQTIQNKIHPRLEEFYNNSSKTLLQRQKSRAAWRQLKISFDEFFSTVSITLVEVTQRLPLISQLLHHFNYLRQERLNTSLSKGDGYKQISTLNKQIVDLSKLYNIEAMQYNKVIKNFQNAIEYIENNKTFDKNIPPGKIVTLLKDIFAKLNDWILSYENVPSQTLQEASNDIEKQFQYARTALKNYTLFELLELNDYTFKYIEY